DATEPSQQREQADAPGPFAADRLQDFDDNQPAAAPTPPRQDTPDEKPGENGRDALTILGRVLDANGKPVAGAKVKVISRGAAGKALAQGDAAGDGRFQLAVPSGALDEGATLVATATGHGPDWAEAPASPAGEVTLQLPPDDVPLEGRILDLENRPVRGATVTVAHLERPRDGDVTAWLSAWRG